LGKPKQLAERCTFIGGFATDGRNVRLQGRWMLLPQSGQVKCSVVHMLLAITQLCAQGAHVATLQLAADDHLAGGINSVDLENRLGDVETDCRDRLHGSLL